MACRMPNQIVPPGTSQMLAVVISESVDGPPLDETVQILRRFLHDVPVITIRRGEAAPTDLLRRIAAVLS